MDRRAAKRLDEALESWARWCEGGSVGVLGGGGASFLSRWMANKGHMVFGTSASSSSPNDTQEGRIHAIVVRLGTEDQLCADVLRLEYGAGWDEVCRRRQLHDYDPRGLNQMQKALHLGISVRTYKGRLKVARDAIKLELWP